MEKNNSKWGKGIPEYKEEDVLKGQDLHFFCVNIAAKEMQKDGFKIIGVLNDIPAQIRAEKDNKTYLALVPAEVAPKHAKVPDELKFKFIDYCNKNNMIPLYVPVEIGSSDPDRFNAGLALKDDGFYVNYTGYQDMSNFKDMA